MKISIITATFNSGKTLHNSLSSVANQTYRDIEHIVIDGLSTDNTIKIAKEFKHISKIISEADNGIYEAMNKGIDLAEGDIIGILNSDDFYVNDEIIQKVVNLFADEELDALYGDLEYIDRIHTEKVVRRWNAGEYRKKKWLYGWMPPHPTFFVRRSVYEKYGKFNLKLKSAADYELMLRFLYKYNVKVKYLPFTMVKMRTGGQSNRTLFNRLLANQEDRAAWLINELKPHPFTHYLKPIRKIKQYF